MRKYKHKNKGWIVEGGTKGCMYMGIINGKRSAVDSIFIEESNDREEIKEKPQRTHDGMYIGDENELGIRYAVDCPMRFETQEKVQKFTDKLKAYKAIKKRQFINDDGWVPDWNYTKEKYIVVYNWQRKKITGIMSRIQDIFQIYYSSEEKVEQAIKELESEYKTLFDIK